MFRKLPQKKPGLVVPKCCVRKAVPTTYPTTTGCTNARNLISKPVLIRLAAQLCSFKRYGYILQKHQTPAHLPKSNLNDELLKSSLTTHILLLDSLEKLFSKYDKLGEKFYMEIITK